MNKIPSSQTTVAVIIKAIAAEHTPTTKELKLSQEIPTNHLSSITISISSKHFQIIEKEEVFHSSPYEWNIIFIGKLDKTNQVRRILG